LKAALFALALLVFAACDPVSASDEAALGPEAPGVEVGPDHRPGQPCLVCHDNDFIVAGTVYDSADNPTGVSDVTVHLFDYAGATHDAVTGRSGNFYVPRQRWTPVWPLKVKVGDTRMNTQIGGQGSCGACHREQKSASSPGLVYLNVPDAGVAP
jgi:hypothetical protein